MTTAELIKEQSRALKESLVALVIISYLFIVSILFADYVVHEYNVAPKTYNTTDVQVQQWVSDTTWKGGWDE